MPAFVKGRRALGLAGKEVGDRLAPMIRKCWSMCTFHPARSPRPCLVWRALNPTLRLDASTIHSSFSSLHVLDLTGTDVNEPQLITARNEEPRKADHFANRENCLRLVSECPLHRGYTELTTKHLLTLTGFGFYSLDILNHAYANSTPPPISYTPNCICPWYSLFSPTSFKCSLDLSGSIEYTEKHSSAARLLWDQWFDMNFLYDLK